MDIIAIRQYCLDKDGVTESAPFGPDVPVYKVLGKMFALIDTGANKGLSLKCNPEKVIELCDKYEGINGAPHLNKKHWIRIELDRISNTQQISKLIDHSYQEVLKTFSKKALEAFKDKHRYKPEYIRLDETPSTNDFHFGSLNLTHDIVPVVYTPYQTAGRGVDSNKWESEAGKNILCSFILHPRFLEPRWAFFVSMAVSLGIREELSQYADGFSIKWPNDIYWKNKKIGGILINNSMSGSNVSSSVVGIGINVNQTEFRSNAPNPISLSQITGQNHDVEQIMHGIIERIIAYYVQLEKRITTTRLIHDDPLHKAYLDALFRKEGFHTFTDSKGKFKARIRYVKPNGEITLEFEDGTSRLFQHKEFQFVIDDD